jgi:integrase
LPLVGFTATLLAQSNRANKVPRRRLLNDKQVAALSRREKRYTLPDPEQPGHYLRVPPRSSRAAVAFAAVARDPRGKQIWMTVGTADVVGIDQAREKAREAIRRIKDGRPSSEPTKLTVEAVAEEWLERHVRGNNLRSARELGRIISRHITPRIGERIFVEVRRRDIAELLDRIEDESGKPMADAVLKTFRAISKWVQRRDENYNPPLTSGMSRVPKEGRRRTRILEDAEIRAIWHTPGQSGDFARLALLTAQRREKLITLRWSDIQDGVWVIATAPREKGNAGKIKLPPAALEIIQRQPKIGDNPYVFAGRGSGPTAIFRSGTHKAQLDEASGVHNWRIHDLRRTARSLMARAGVQSEIAERILGHAQGELIQIYNRHDYLVEIADALTKLSELIKQITSA